MKAKEAHRRVVLLRGPSLGNVAVGTGGSIVRSPSDLPGVAAACPA